MWDSYISEWFCYILLQFFVTRILSCCYSENRVTRVTLNPFNLIYIYICRIKESARFCNPFCNREGHIQKYSCTKLGRFVQFEPSRRMRIGCSLQPCWWHVVRVSSVLFQVVQILESSWKRASRKHCFMWDVSSTIFLLYNREHDRTDKARPWSA